jgi:hypothetical protein
VSFNETSNQTGAERSLVGLAEHDPRRVKELLSQLCISFGQKPIVRDTEQFSVREAQRDRLGKQVHALSEEDGLERAPISVCVKSSFESGLTHRIRFACCQPFLADDELAAKTQRDLAPHRTYGTFVIVERAPFDSDALRAFKLGESQLLSGTAEPAANLRLPSGQFWLRHDALLTGPKLLKRKS